jgi:hypothetical protein
MGVKRGSKHTKSSSLTCTYPAATSDHQTATISFYCPAGETLTCPLGPLVHDRVGFSHELESVCQTDEPGLVGLFARNDELSVDGAVGEDLLKIDVDVCTSAVD